MNETNKKIAQTIKNLLPELSSLSDQIFDFAEIGYKEYKSSALLADWLSKNGFEVTIPFAGLETAFCGIYKHKGGKANGGLSIGFLGEYDALHCQGHVCAHHMQTPSMIGAAMALINVLSDSDLPYEIHIIGTPSEEALDGGKNIMAENGGFDNIDVAFMVHGNTCTQLDSPTLALIELDIEFFGKSSHAGIAPDEGRSAVDAITMLQTGLGLMRNHLKDGSRVSNIILNGGVAVNAVPDYTKIKVEIRHNTMDYLETIEDWVRNIAEGSALATGTKTKITRIAHIYNTTMNEPLRKLLMQYANEFNCADIKPPREKCGSTDYGIVTQKLPSCSIWVKTIDVNAPPHTDAWYDAGKKPRNYQGIFDGAAICAATAYHILTDKNAFDEIYNYFKNK